MEKNRFKQLLESTMGDVKPLLESDESNNFVVTNATTIEEFTAYLDKKIEASYGFGDEATLGFIIEYLIKNSLVSTGKPENEAESIAKDFCKNLKSSSSYEDDGYGESLERGYVYYKNNNVFDFASYGGGYSFSGDFDELDELFDDIKNLVA
jgi:hypothetical protein